MKICATAGVPPAYEVQFELECEIVTARRRRPTILLAFDAALPQHASLSSDSPWFLTPVWEFVANVFTGLLPDVPGGLLSALFELLPAS